MKNFEQYRYNLLNNFNLYINNDETLEDEEDIRPALEKYGTDLTLLAKEGQLEQYFGREKELIELMEILARRQKNNPILVGDAGVGKTAIIELFAQKIVNNLVPFILEGRTLISLDLGKLSAGARYRGEFEARFQEIIDELKDQPDILLFIDEIHTLAGTTFGNDTAFDGANLLKPALSRHHFNCIGATTSKDYQQFEKDIALNRYFQPVYIKELSVDETIEILYNLRPIYETYHNVEISPSALRLAATLSARYIQDRFLPDKAIDLIDRVAAREVIALTNVKKTSFISALANTTLNHLGQLRLEAFRRGDISTEYIFQEIENAYRKFLLTWIQNPLEIPEKPEKNLSPISLKLFEKMRASVITRVDELLFASPISKKITKIKKNKRNLTNIKNIEIYSDILEKINEKNFKYLSKYRISLFLFKFWIKNQNLFSLRKNIQRISFFYKFYEYLNNLYKIYGKNSFKFQDFFKKDIENQKVYFEKISEMEQIQIDIFNNFLKDFKPILRKGIAESLNRSSELKLTDKEIKTIYTLLGYFSEETNQNFLLNLKQSIFNQNINNFENFIGIKKLITEKEVSNLVSEITGIPTQSLSTEESERLLNLETSLHERVIGQEEAISAIAKAIRRSRLGLQNPNRPIASFLFCGPTGVGKTEITKALAVSMFGSENDMIRLDMSEFMEKFTISRLIGSPPGYVGYEDGGQLTDAVRKKPYSVVLFDELEKAHPDVLNILLQILEDGRLTDNQKRLISFENTVIIMTSNAAAEDIQQIIKSQRKINNIDEENKKLNEKTKKFETLHFFDSTIKENYLTDIKKHIKEAFKSSSRDIEQNRKNYLDQIKFLETKTNENDTNNQLKTAVINRLSSIFLPEFLNRLDDIIIFQPLKPEELRKICDIMIKQLTKRVLTKNITLIVEEKVKVKMAREGYNPAFGARPLRRLVTKYLEDALSEFLLKNPLNNKKITLKIVLNEQDKIIVKSEK
jgi:ATP-dependent Clp protease ATP-binding subunit ClpA